MPLDLNDPIDKLVAQQTEVDEVDRLVQAQLAHASQTDSVDALVQEKLKEQDTATLSTQKGLPIPLSQELATRQFFKDYDKAMDPIEFAKAAYVWGKDVIQHDVETLKNMGETGMWDPSSILGKPLPEDPKIQAAIRTGNVSMALADFALVGSLSTLLKQAGPLLGKKAASLFKRTVPSPRVPDPGIVAKEATTAGAISEVGKTDPIEAHIEQLQFEFQRYHDLDSTATAKYRASQKAAIAQQAQRQAAGEPPVYPGESYNQAYTQFQPTAMETDLFGAFESKIPTTSSPSPAIQIATELETDLALSKSMSEIRKANIGAMRGIERKSMTTVITALSDASNPVGRQIATAFVKYSDLPAIRAAGQVRNIEPSWNALNRKERDHVIDWLNDQWFKGESGAVSFVRNVAHLSPKTQAVAELIAKETAITTEAGRVSGAHVSTNPRPFWSQHLIDPTKAASNPKMLSYLVKTGQAPDMVTAQKFIDQWARKYADREFAGFERARTFYVGSAKDLRELGFDTDLSALQQYFEGSHRRIEGLVQFGKNEVQGFVKMHDELAKTHPHEASIANMAFNRITNREPVDETARKVIQGLTTYGVLRFLGLAQIAQFLSIPSVVARVGFRKGLMGITEGFQALINKSGSQYDLAARSASLIHSVQKDLHAAYQANKTTEWYLKVGGINVADGITRLMATHAGKYYVSEVTTGLLANPGNKKLLRAAKELFIDVEQLAKNKGLTNEQYLHAIKRYSDGSVGRTRTIDMPIMWSHPLLGTQTLFRKFAIFQTSFMYKHIYKEAALGNFRPIATYTAFGLPLGEAYLNARAKLKGKQRPGGSWEDIAKQVGKGRVPEEIGTRLVDDLSAISAFAIFGDIILSMSYGEQRTEETILGAPLTAISKATSALIDSLTTIKTGVIEGLQEKTGKRMKKTIGQSVALDNHKRLIKTVIKHLEGVPYIGQPLTAWVLKGTYPEDVKEGQKIWRR